MGIVRNYHLIGEALWARFNPDADQVWYYGALLWLFEERLPGPVTEELRQAYNTLQEMMKVSKAIPPRDGSPAGVPGAPANTGAE